MAAKTALEQRVFKPLRIIRIWKNCILRHKSIDAIDAAAFSALADNMTLTEVDLSGNEISDKAILKFAASTHIRDLVLWRNRLGDASAIAFANNTNINKLQVDENPIGNKGVQTLLASSIAYLDV